MNSTLSMMAGRPLGWTGPSVGHRCDRRKDHCFRPSMGRGCDHRKDHEIFMLKILRLVWWWSKKWAPLVRGIFPHKDMITTCWIYCCIINNWLNIMILFVIMFVSVVSLQVHSMYWPGMSCQISSKSRWKGVLYESRSCPHRCPCDLELPLRRYSAAR